MSGQIEIFYNDGHLHDHLQVAGEFTEWQPVPLGLDEGTQYAAVFEGATPGQSYMYKYVIDGHWQLLPGKPTVTDSGGNVNHPVVAVKAKEVPLHKEGVTADKLDGTDGHLGSMESKSATKDLASEPTVAYASNYTDSKLGSTTNSNFDFKTQYNAGLNDPKAAVIVGPNAAYNSAYTPADQTKSVPHSTQLQHPAEVVHGLNRFGGAPTTTSSHLEKPHANPDTFDFTGSQLSHPVDYVPNLDKVTSNTNSTQYHNGPDAAGKFDYKESQLDGPIEKVSGLDNVKTDPDAIYTGPDASGKFDYTTSQLSDPIEKVSGLGGVQTGFGAFGRNGPDAAGSFNYEESQLDDPIDKVDDPTFQSAVGALHKGPDAAGKFDYKESQLDGPIEKVSDLDNVKTGPDAIYTGPDASGKFDYTTSQLSDPIEKVGGLCNVKTGPDAVYTGPDASGKFDYTTSQLSDPIEKVGGINDVHTGPGAVDNFGSFNYNESQLSDPIEKVSGLDGVHTGVGAFGSAPTAHKSTGPDAAGKFDYTEPQLSDPVEKVSGLDNVRTGPGAVDNFGSFNYKESKLSDPIDIVRGNQPDAGGKFDYKESQLDHPIDVVRGHDKIETGPEAISKSVSNAYSSSTATNNPLSTNGHYSTNGYNAHSTVTDPTSLSLPKDRPTVSTNLPSRRSLTTSAEAELDSDLQEEVDILRQEEIEAANQARQADREYNGAQRAADAELKACHSFQREGTAQRAQQAHDATVTRSGAERAAEAERKAFASFHRERPQDRINFSHDAATQQQYGSKQPTVPVLLTSEGGNARSASSYTNQEFDRSYQSASDDLFVDASDVQLEVPSTVGLCPGSSSYTAPKSVAAPSGLNGTGLNHSSNLHHQTSAYASNSTHSSSGHGYSPSFDRETTDLATSQHSPVRRTFSPTSQRSHQPIDVNTGFPIDDLSGVTRATSASRRSDKRRSAQAPPPQGVVSCEHRNAAVIAAAAKASAFAKQDVAAISNPPRGGASQTDEQGIPFDYVPAKTPNLPIHGSSRGAQGNTGSLSLDNSKTGCNPQLARAGSFERVGSGAKRSDNLQRTQSSAKPNKFKRFFKRFADN